MDVPLRRNSVRNPNILAIVALALVAPGAMRAQLSCIAQSKAFGPYLLFQLKAAGYKFTEVPLDATHYIILQYNASTELPEVSELCLDTIQTQTVGKELSEPSRLASTNNAMGSAAQNVATGDFNGDGIVDAVVTGPHNNVSVYLANSDHSLKSPVIHGVGFRPVSIIVADFNGDGKLDLAVANLDSNNVSVLLGNGDGSFRPVVNYATGASPASVVAADLNGDGKLDLAIADLGSFASPAGGVSILLGNGDGTFKSAVTLPAEGAPLAVVSADFNGDGKADLAVAHTSSSYVSVFLGNGDGTFKPAAKFEAGIGPKHLAFGDFNGDGKPDLAVIHRGNGILSILLGSGNGSFQPAVQYLAGAPPETVRVVDVHGDGKLDLLVGGGANYLAVLPGNGDGTFQAPPSYAAGAGPQSVGLADFNGDGVEDIVTANATSNDVSVLLGSGGSKFQPAIASAVGSGASSNPPSPVDLAVADFNADGKPDVAVADEQSNDVSILIGKGDGSFQAGVHYPAGVNPNSLVAADFNGDGKIDLAVANTDHNSTRGAGNVSVLLGNGDGTFHGATNINAGPHPVQVMAADFNGDGKLDLAMLNSGSFAVGFKDASVSILLGNGNGTFQPSKDYPAGLNPTAMAVGDVNGDGKLDVIIATQAPDLSYIVLVLRGTGDGGFQTPVTQPTDYGARAISIADLNLDGKPDLVIAHCCGNTDMIYFLGNGDGTFQPEVHFPGGDSSTAVVVADLSHDGRPDAVITAGGSGGIGVSSVAIILNSFALAGLANVSAASFEVGPVTAESIVSAFAAHLATDTKPAPSIPLPTVLAGTTVKVRDAAGTERLAPLFYVSPGQVNYEVPPGTTLGTATVTITAGDNTSISAPLQIVPVAPGIFELNSNALVAANVLRVKTGNVQTAEAVYKVDPTTKQVVALPVDMGPATDQVYLLIYGTGIRGRSHLSAVSVTIGGASAKVSYAGPQGFFVGLDQVNVLVPSSLRGRGEVNIVLTADGKSSNVTRVTIK